MTFIPDKGHTDTIHNSQYMQIQVEQLTSVTNANNNYNEYNSLV